MKDMEISISGINVEQGIMNSGGTAEKYFRVLNVLYKDLMEKMPILQTIPDESTLRNFQIQVHAQKSALAIIGAKEISEKAALLEDACKREDFDFIQKNQPVFAEELTELTGNIYTALESASALMPEYDNALQIIEDM